MEDKALIQYKKMTETKISKLILTLGIPTTISMLVTAIYNIGDTFYVSRLGESASGAVGVVFPLMAIIQAIGFTLGMGAGSMISLLLGKHENEEANKYGVSAMFGAVLFGIIFTLLGSIFIEPLLNMLGASKTIFPYAKDYATYILYGAPIMTMSFVLNNILRAEGKAKFSMIGLTTGGILNLLLDPLFIFTFNLGISGAAIATIISQFVSFSILLSWFLIGKSITKIKIKYISHKMYVYSTIVKTGFPSLCRQGFACLSTILLNNAAKEFGDSAVSAMGIVSKVFMVMFSIALGIGQGYQPVVGYNYSAKRMDRVKQAFRFTLIVGVSFLAVLSIGVFFFSKELIRVFLDIDKVVEIGSKTLQYQCIALPFLGLNVVTNMTFQSIGKKIRATLLSIARQGIFYIPLILVLPGWLGIKGIEMVQGCADILTFLFTVPFIIHFFKNLDESNKNISIL